MYRYTADTPEQAVANVKAYAGRVQGGDFKWVFDNSVDDAAYEVNQPLKDALMAYKGWDGTVSIESSSASDITSSSSSEQKQGILVGKRLEISGQEMYRINVFSMTGKKVLTSYGNAIDLSSLPPGNYIVQLTGTTGSSLQKIYVQRTTF